MSEIIRADSPQARVMHAEVWDAKQQAKRIIAQAEKTAQALLEKTHHEINALKSEAITQAQANSHADVAHLLINAQRIFDTALSTAEHELAHLAIASAERIIHDTINLEPNRIRTIVQQAIRHIRQAKQLRIFVHPEDKALLEADPLETKTTHEALEFMSFIEDPGLSRGSCVISTELGEVDARIETQLELIRAALQR